MAIAALSTSQDLEFHKYERRWREVIERNGLTGLGAPTGDLDGEL